MSLSLQIPFLSKPPQPTCFYVIYLHLETFTNAHTKAATSNTSSRYTSGTFLDNNLSKPAAQAEMSLCTVEISEYFTQWVPQHIKKKKKLKKASVTASSDSCS